MQDAWSALCIIRFHSFSSAGAMLVVPTDKGQAVVMNHWLQCQINATVHVVRHTCTGGFELLGQALLNPSFVHVEQTLGSTPQPS